MNSKIFAMILVLIPAGLRAQSVTFDEYIRTRRSAMATARRP